MSRLAAAATALAAISSAALAAISSPALSSGAAPAAAKLAAAMPATARTPVLVELFTSEGCSSCPPADAVLARLVREQPIDGVEVIGLGEHVDYWNNLGWKDPFSAHAFTERQERYAAGMGTGRIYTPQAMVAGQLDVLGSDEDGIRKAALSLRDRPRGTLSVAQVETGGTLSAKLTAKDLPEHAGAEVLVALVEDGLVSEVTAGENSGRTLPHAAVVRTLSRLGDASGAGFERDLRLKLDPSWRRGSLRLVAFVQEREGGRVLAAGEWPLPGGQPGR